MRTQMMQDPHINAELMTVCKSEVCSYSGDVSNESVILAIEHEYQFCYSGVNHYKVEVTFIECN